MYYDLKFPYKISAEAGLAHDENGNNAEAYLMTSLNNCTNTPNEKKYARRHESLRQGLASSMGLKLEWIIPITPEEYEANADDREVTQP